MKGKEAKNSSDCFSFKLVTIDIRKEIIPSDISKTTQTDDMPIKVIQIIPTFFLFFLSKLEQCYWNKYFSRATKICQCETIFQKDAVTDKKNYRSIRIFPVSKIYKKCLNRQLEANFQAP